MSLTASAVFFLALLGPCLWAAWSDLKSMTIPNAVVLACLALFLVTAPFVLPLEDMLWRLATGVLVLVAGFCLFLTGQFGAGDAKFAAALTPFVARIDLPTVLWIYAATALLSVGAVALVKWRAPAFAAASGFRALRERRRFPLGLPLALTILVYLALRIRHGLIIS